MRTKRGIIFTENTAKETAEKLNIPISEVCQALGIPMPEVIPGPDTLERAEEDYYKAPKKSPERAAALNKWRKFSAKEVEVAENLKQTEEAYYRTPSGSPEEVAALKKWREISADAVEAAQDLEQAEEAYWEAPYGSPEKTLALRKWHELSKKLKAVQVLEQAETFKQAEIFYLMAFIIGDPKETAATLRKMVKLSVTLGQVRKICQRVAYGTPERAAALKKWREISAKEVEAAETLKEVKEAYRRAPEMGPERKTAIYKAAYLTMDNEKE